MALLWEMGGSATGVLITDRIRERCGDGQNNTPYETTAFPQVDTADTRETGQCQNAARAEYDRSGGIGISVAGSLNPGSFSSAPRMPTLGEDDLRSPTRSASFPGPSASMLGGPVGVLIELPKRKRPSTEAA